MCSSRDDYCSTVSAECSTHDDSAPTTTRHGLPIDAAPADAVEWVLEHTELCSERGVLSLPHEEGTAEGRLRVDRVASSRYKRQCGDAATQAAFDYGELALLWNSDLPELIPFLNPKVNNPNPKVNNLTLFLTSARICSPRTNSC